MRLWSVHPRYLDAKGLVALWREALLAQAVLDGKTRGYKSHPQLSRFKAQNDPLTMIGAYLRVVHHEAVTRGYNFDKSKIKRATGVKVKMAVTRGQLEFEFRHLKRKLKSRDINKYKALLKVTRISAHPLFKPKTGHVETWEVTQ